MFSLFRKAASALLKCLPASRTLPPATDLDDRLRNDIGLPPASDGRMPAWWDVPGFR